MLFSPVSLVSYVTPLQLYRLACFVAYRSRRGRRQTRESFSCREQGRRLAVERPLKRGTLLSRSFLSL